MEHSKTSDLKGSDARSNLLRMDNVLLAYTSCAEVGMLSGDVAR